MTPRAFVAAALAVTTLTIAVPQFAFAGGSVVRADIYGPHHDVRIGVEAHGARVDTRVTGGYNVQHLDVWADHSTTRVNQFGTGTVFNGRIVGRGGHKDIWVGCARDGHLRTYDDRDRPIQVLGCD